MYHPATLGCEESVHFLILVLPPRDREGAFIGAVLFVVVRELKTVQRVEEVVEPLLYPGLLALPCQRLYGAPGPFTDLRHGHAIHEESTGLVERVFRVIVGITH